MTSNRATSVGSTSSSAAEWSTVKHINKQRPHPEEWTLLKEWNIEKRELFENWKVDVQKQISNITGSLEKSLQTFPHPDVGKTFHTNDEWRGSYVPDQLLTKGHQLRGSNKQYQF